MPDYLMVTNNPLAAEAFSGRCRVECDTAAPYREVLRRARDLVYIGHVLYTHPLYGSLRPHETPCRTVVLSAAPQAPDMESAYIMSEAMRVCDHFTPADPAAMTPDILRDYRMIDLDLIRHATEHMDDL